MTNKFVYNYSGRKRGVELDAGHGAEALDGANQINYGLWFIFKSHLSNALAVFFGKSENYFYGASFAINVLAWIKYIFSFAFAANKNIGKISNLTIRTVSVALLCIMSFGFFPFTSPIVIGALIASVLLYPTIHAIKTFYFGFKCVAAEEQDKEFELEKKEFYFSKLKENLLIVLVGAIIVGGLILLYGVPWLLPGVMMGIGIFGATVVLVSQVWKLMPIIKQKLIPKLKELFGIASAEKVVIEDKSKKLMVKVAPELKTGGKGVMKRVVAAREFDYFQYAVTPVVTDLNTFKQEIEEYIEELRLKQRTTNRCLLAEHKKLNNKIGAITFLKELIGMMDKVPASSDSLIIAGKKFCYRNEKEFVQKIDKHVLSVYPDVYESTFKMIGKAEAYFRAFYQYCQQSCPVQPDEGVSLPEDTFGPLGTIIQNPI